MKRNLLLPFLLVPHLCMGQFTADPEFADEGVFTLPNTDPTISHRMARGPDGSFFIKLNDSEVSSTATYILHLLSDGTPDPDFGTNGRANFSGSYVEDIAVQNDGKLIMVGSTPDTDPRGFILRLNVNGIPDATFGLNGFFHHSAVENVSRVAITSSGSIIATGSSGADPATGIIGVQVIRLSLDGTLDPNYAANLNYVPCIPFNFWPQVDGSMIVNNQLDSLDATDMGLIRIDQNGNVDPSFNNGLGYYKPFVQPFGMFLDVTLDLEGRIVALYFNAQQRSVHRLLHTGVPDSTFHEVGYVQEPISQQGSQGQLIDTDTLGRIVIAHLQPIGIDGHAMMISRYLANGMPDGTVGPAGRQYLTALPALHYGITCMATDGNDRIKLLYPQQGPDILDDTYALVGLRIAPTSVAHLQGTEALLVFPNPATESIRILAEGHRVARLFIHDASGRLVYNEQRASESGLDVDISYLEPGYYRVTLVDDDHDRFTRSIIKE